MPAMFILLLTGDSKPHCQWQATTGGGDGGITRRRSNIWPNAKSECNFRNAAGHLTGPMPGGSYILLAPGWLEHNCHFIFDRQGSTNCISESDTHSVGVCAVCVCLVQCPTPPSTRKWLEEDRRMIISGCDASCCPNHKRVLSSCTITLILHVLPIR